MSQCPQMLAFKHSTKPSLPAYPFMKVFGLFTRRSYFAACEQNRCRSVCEFSQSHQCPYCSLFRKHMGLFETKPAFGAYDKARPKQVYIFHANFVVVHEKESKSIISRCVRVRTVWHFNMCGHVVRASAASF